MRVLCQSLYNELIISELNIMLYSDLVLEIKFSHMNHICIYIIE